MRRTLLLFLCAACSSGPGGGGDDDGGPSVDAGGPDGGPVCPTYQSFCGTGCIPTSVDPDNCGGCNVVCDSTQVCSAGDCVDAASCLPGLMTCGRSCVDVMTDNDHCGGCPTTCPSGEGCVEGSCEPALITDPPPAACAGGGPPISVDVGGTEECTGGLAQTTFRWALCSCTDVSSSSSLFTDGYDSTIGPYIGGGLGGGVGMNGMFGTSGTSQIGGALWASSPTGMNPSNTLNVRQELHVGGPFTPKTTIVDDSAWVDGNIATTATIGISGTLHQQTGGTISGTVTFGGGRVEEEVTVPPPCDCEPAELIPVAAIVAARQAANDNATIGLDAGALVTPGAPQRLDLPCGHFYLDGISGSQPVAVVAHGHVALYIGGNVQLSKELRFAVDPAGTLDIFIAGNLSTSSALAVGSPAFPALTRLYIGGTTGFGISAGARLGAFFYAPFGQVSGSSSIDVFGGIFAGDFQNSGATRIHYDRAVLEVGQDCGTEPPPGCSSCQDCGNQACVGGTCGACTDSSECCAPLVCFQGRCEDVVE